MIKNGFLRFCDDPELACCRAERELGQLREKNVQLRSQLQDAERRERAAVEDMAATDKCDICLNDERNGGKTLYYSEEDQDYYPQASCAIHAI